VTVETRPIAEGRNPLEPIASIIALLLVAMGALTLLGTALTIFSTGSFLGFGSYATPRVDVPALADSGGLAVAGWHIRPGVFGSQSSLSIAVEHPDFTQRFWYTLIGLPTFVIIIAGLLMAHRTISRARRDGIHTVATARRVRTLGWFLIAGSLSGMLIEEVASNRLLATMVTNHVGWVTSLHWHFPWTLLIFGGTLLTIARVMRISARMNEELEATV